jgi:toxin ParE1/3/4
LKAIHDFIASDSRYYAKKIVQDIIDKTDILHKYPRIGRKLPEIDDDTIREIFAYSYRILYEIKSENIYILGIIHGKQDITPTHVYRSKEP